MNGKKSEAAIQQKHIEGRVAQILNARELVINIGVASGVREGMKFAVLSESPMEIRDPETNELLDTIDREKVRVKATEVREKVSICKTYVTRTIPGGRLYGGALSGITDLINLTGEMRPPQTIVETLKADDKDFPPPLSPQESYVRIKDRVIQIVEDD